MDDLNWVELLTMVFKKRDNQSSLADVLPDLLLDKGWLKQLDLHSIFPRWQELVGDDLGKYAKPLKIEREVLWLEVENSAWLQQFQYEKMALLEELNRHLKLGKLKDVKMLLPKGKGQGSQQVESQDGSAITFEKPSEAHVAAFQRQVESIQDEKCRESLMRFWYLAQACKKKED